MESVREVSEGIIVEIKVKPNSGRTLLYRKDQTLVMELRNPPEGNKANTELVLYMKKLFGKEARILKGGKSKNKLVLVQKLSKNDFENLISVQ